MYRNTKIQSFNTLLDELDRLRVQWGSCQDIPFVGWADVSFAIEDIEISVPMIVGECHGWKQLGTPAPPLSRLVTSVQSPVKNVKNNVQKRIFRVVCIEVQDIYIRFLL